MPTSTSVSMHEETIGDVIVISFPESWDMHSENANRLRIKLDGLMKSGAHNIILNLKEIDFACSEAVNTIVNAANKLRNKGGDLKILHLQGRTKEIFSHMRIDSILGIFESEEDALRAFQLREVH